MSSLNILATSKDVYRFLKGPPGWKVVGLDINALEPHVVAHFSQCPALMGLYGPDAVPNQDAYIWLGTTMPQFSHFNEYYNPTSPTKEGVEYVKDNYDSDRFICKTTFLSSMYGIYPPGLQAAFAKGGVEMPLKEVEGILRAYWRTFKAVKDFSRQLQGEWRKNGGYIISGRGTPIVMDHKGASEDILSRFTQKTGHQYVMRWLYHINDVRRERGILAKPLVPDLHDSTTWTCPEEEVGRTGDMLQEGLTRLNDELGLTIKFKGKTKIGDTLELMG